MRSRRRLPVEELAPYLFPDPPREHPAEPIDWATLFCNPRPVEIEVGFGKGLFLLNAGSSKPDVNFFGVEIDRKCQLYTATRLAIRKLTNVKVACADAKALLRDRVPPASVQSMHVYFPDPWWKTRHHKRRLFTADFVASVASVLRPGGHFHIVTDVEDYFQMVRQIMKTAAEFEPIPPVEATSATHDLDYLTNFERKFRKEGRPIYRASYARRSG